MLNPARFKNPLVSNTVIIKSLCKDSAQSVASHSESTSRKDWIHRKRRKIFRNQLRSAWWNFINQTSLLIEFNWRSEAFIWFRKIVFKRQQFSSFWTTIQKMQKTWKNKLSKKFRNAHVIFRSKIIKSLWKRLWKHDFFVFFMLSIFMSLFSNFS